MSSLLINNVKVSRAMVFDRDNKLIHNLPVIAGGKSKATSPKASIQSAIRLAGLVNVLLKNTTGLQQIIPDDGFLVLYDDTNIQVGKFQWKNVGGKRSIVKLQDLIFK